MINGRPTLLQGDKENWIALQTPGAGQILISGTGTIDRTAVGKLLDIRLNDDLTLNESSVPSGAEVHAAPVERPSYSIGYVGGGSDDDRVRIEVSAGAYRPQEPPAESKTFTRAGRKFVVITPERTPETPSDIPRKNVIWDSPEGNHMLLSASRSGDVFSDDALVGLATAVRPANSREWALALRVSGDSRYRSQVLQATEAVMADGVEIPVQLEMDTAEPTRVCRNVLLRWNVRQELNEGTSTCVFGTESGPYKLLATERVNGVPVVYGLTSLQGENQVVVITDADGYVVGEEVTLDNPILKLRSFTIGLPDDAVAPFTVELYDFDRAWYVEDPNREPKSYVRPDQEPYATTQLALP